MNIYLIKNYFKKIFRNSGRLVLTLSGLVLSVVILMIVLILSETILADEMNTVNLYKSGNIVVADCEFDYDTYMYFKTNDNYNVRMELVTLVNKALVNIPYGDNMSTTVWGRCIQVDENWNEFFLPQDNGIDVDRYNSELLCGRLINSNDVLEGKNVIVIDDITSKILFNKNEAVGEFVDLQGYDSNGEYIYKKYKVVGVIKATDYSEQLMKKMIEEINDGEITEGPFLNFYVPYTSNYFSYSSDNYEMRLIFTSDTENYISLTDRILEDAVKGGYKVNTVENADDIYAERAEEIANMQSIMIKIMIVVFIISGLCIMNTMIFSVKERISEIGIRKAMGAFNGDILIQFVFEGVVYGLISGIIGIIISIVIATFAYYIFEDAFIGISKIVVSPESVVMAIAAAVLVSVVASIIPAVYASRIKIADALKFD